MHAVRVALGNLVVLAFLLVLVELGARVQGYAREPGHQLRLVDFRREAVDALLEDRPLGVRVDPELGYVLEPSAGVAEGWGGVPVTVAPDGLRSNGDAAPELPPRPLALAVGDSYTFGYGAGDGQTWPARLEAALGLRVLNAGVPGYGMGQSILRAERLAPELHPDIVILGIIDQDVKRIGYSVNNGLPKPMFRLEGSRLVLETPSQARRRLAESRIRDRVYGVLGYSYLAHRFLSQLDPESWLTRDDWLRAKEYRDTGPVACRLLVRFAALDAPRKVMFVEHPAKMIAADRHPDQVRQAVACAGQLGIEVVDVFGPLRSLHERDAEAFASLYRDDGHMTARGNIFVADVLARRLRPPARAD